MLGGLFGGGQLDLPASVNYQMPLVWGVKAHMMLQVLLGSGAGDHGEGRELAGRLS